MKHYHFQSISSTNDYIREILHKESPVAVSADYQWLGRGRNNHRWEGNFGQNVYLSIGKYHSQPISPDDAAHYQSLGCLLVKEALVRLTGDNVFRIKYPNDVMAPFKGHYRKLCGVLVEHGYLGSQCIYSIIGMGINVLQKQFPEDISHTVTSLSLSGYKVEPSDLINELIARYEHLSDLANDTIFDMWRKELNIEGKPVQIVDDDDEWIAESLLWDCRLMVRNKNGSIGRYINNGDSIRYDYE
jgi:BirA family transcriptional regulator, biotin operon repressor / biotin---[acetyl-CoA-carboxylase] ligase